MLVLTRKFDQRIHIGEDIVITILEARGDSVKIGIDAPRGLKIQRGEILDAVSEANLSATAAGPEAVQMLKTLLSGRPVEDTESSAAASEDKA
ncbi:carbon storage regulator CsrA [Arthrobacter crystallopoietes BAB-32]|uniref:Translational regulator CsrA n=1 Tax=Arthrobacter crystallopoietes BAB-32 TaxID=1246476 RepID=N1V172_9MICC|nr:carbon storage regulator [Arthrobacter crystallopoietes]EMY33749.1 carbon storage regulator CsrA [Arthrobacter crystallopoietes BAB-32]